MALVVAALGGNALLRRGQPMEVEVQRENIAVAVDALAALERDHDLVVTHGNGPQVGLLALEAEAYSGAPAPPLDVLGAESEGMIGYLLEQGLHGRTRRPPAALLTTVRVDADDPAFSAPSKPIGPVYDRAGAERLRDERGWAIAADGEYWRRVVASPEPREIVELSTIGRLLAADTLVICAGGGGIPVVADGHGALHGVEAVIDKDLAAALLADALDADILLLLTDVEHVVRGYGSEDAQPIGEIAADELDASQFAAGSMRPKVMAAARFAARPGRMAGIGALADAAAIAAGERGTRVICG
jgi:carbamate kinase